ncbi:MAG: hypothetical protein QM647_14720 [Asticcacaulis sp.]
MWIFKAMKRFIYILLAAITACAVAMSWQVAAHSLSHRDWAEDRAATASDLRHMLKYRLNT